MTDYFALLDEPRRPWIDPGPLKEKFLARSSEVHPDRFHQLPETGCQAAQTRYAELNAAHQCLADPRARLLHLLELELGRKSPAVQEMPGELPELFLETGALLKATDACLQERASVTSPLLRAQLFARGIEQAERVQSFLARLAPRREVLLAELRTMNTAWETAPSAGAPARVAALPLPRLERIAQELSCLNRWTGQLQERLVLLAM